MVKKVKEAIISVSTGRDLKETYSQASGLQASSSTKETLTNRHIVAPLELQMMSSEGNEEIVDTEADLEQSGGGSGPGKRKEEL